MRRALRSIRKGDPIPVGLLADGVRLSELGGTFEALVTELGDAIVTDTGDQILVRV